MESLRQGKHLLRCLRWATAELRYTARANKWKLNSRCLTDQADAKKAVEKIEEPIQEEKVMSKYDREREERKKFKTEYYVVPTKFEKYLLVFSGSYPSVEEVPELITQTQILAIKDKIRAKAAIVLTIISGVVAFIIIKFSSKEFEQFLDFEAKAVKPDFDKSIPLKRKDN